MLESLTARFLLWRIVSIVADSISCGAVDLPFIHLGVPVGQTMTCVSAWSYVIDRFRTRLVGWKAKTLSFGGRLTIVKSVLGSLGSYLMSIFLVPMSVLTSLEALRAKFFWGADVDERRMHRVRWDRVLASREEGGLGVGSLFSFNRAMMFRWWWIFYHSPNLLWARLVKYLYGPDGGCKSLPSRIVSTGPWIGVMRMFIQLRDRGLDIRSLCPIRVGDGCYTSFWHDVWMGETSLATTFHRVFA